MRYDNEVIFNNIFYPINNAGIMCLQGHKLYKCAGYGWRWSSATGRLWSFERLSMKVGFRQAVVKLYIQLRLVWGWRYVNVYRYIKNLAKIKPRPCGGVLLWKWLDNSARSCADRSSWRSELSIQWDVILTNGRHLWNATKCRSQIRSGGSGEGGAYRYWFTRWVTGVANVRTSL